MAHGRWYPTVLTLGDGRIMTFSGVDENVNTNSTVEFYTVGSGWSQPYRAFLSRPLSADASAAQWKSVLRGSAARFEHV